MDEWNDFGTFPAHGVADNDSIEPDTRTQGSFVSLPSSEGGDEPVSVMFRAEGGRGSSSAGPPSRRSGLSAERGDLDSDFDEIGVSSTEATPLSETYRFHRKSYTKLEVISAMQIQKLMHAFHAFVALATVITIICIILGNSVFLTIQPIFVPPILLNAAQLARSKEIFEIFLAEVRPHSRTAVFPEQRFDNALLPNQPLLRSPENFIRTSARLEHYPGDNQERVRTCIFLLRGIRYQFTELFAVEPEDCCTPGHIFHDEVRDFCSSDLSALARQSVPAPAAQNQTGPGQQSGSQTNGTGDSQTLAGGSTSNGTAANGTTTGPARPTGVVRPNRARFEWVEYRFTVAWRWYRAFVHAVIIATGAIVFCAGSLFLIRVSKAGQKNLTQEQSLACALLFATFLYLNIPLSLLQGSSALGVGGGNYNRFATWFSDLETPFRVLRDSAFGPFMVFYVWACLHSYRILDPNEKLGAAFYIPKLLLVVPYGLMKIAALMTVKLVFSEVPFMSLFIFAHTYRDLQMWRAYKYQTVYLIVLSVYELALLAIVTWEGFRTTKALRRAPYMRHRSKHIGYRFFLYITMVHFGSFFALQFLLLVARPRGELIGFTGISTDLILIIPWTHTTGTILLAFGYAIISAYVNLPYNSVGAIKGWFKSSDLAPSSSHWSASSSETSFSGSDRRSGSGAISAFGGSSSPADHLGREQLRFIVDKDYELNQEILEPITYRKRESEDALELKANCFTMQTHVIMFNFAWYVYYYGTPKFDNLKPQESVLPFRFSVAESISEPETDTHALVIDGVDRIVVTFKGTTSMRNLQTSVKIYHEKLINVVPTPLDGVDEQERLRLIFGRSYDTAKIHKGFAVAYASVAERVMRRIKALVDERPRPVFLTGHSLGGALATICSLDVWIKLRISRRQIFVSTFGSPRVGNEAFKRIYNSVIALHWRIVVDPDMVAKLPKVGYRHVGKKVLLTPHGEMFIDPNALELKLWSGNTAGFAYHRKASYLLAMRAWCVRHHKMTYTPAFWPFPVREEDYQRFEGANIEEEEKGETGNVLAKKIIRMDAMVDFLDDEKYDNMAAIERWARLTRRVLLNSKLNVAMSQSVTPSQSATPNQAASDE